MMRVWLTKFRRISLRGGGGGHAGNARKFKWLVVQAELFVSAGVTLLQLFTRENCCVFFFFFPLLLSSLARLGTQLFHSHLPVILYTPQVFVCTGSVPPPPAPTFCMDHFSPPSCALYDTLLITRDNSSVNVGFSFAQPSHRFFTDDRPFILADRCGEAFAGKGRGPRRGYLPRPIPPRRGWQQQRRSTSGPIDGPNRRTGGSNRPPNRDFQVRRG